MRIATQVTGRTPDPLPAASQGPQVTHVTLSTLPGEGPFPVLSPPRYPPHSASCAAGCCSRKPPGWGWGDRQEVPAVPAVAGTSVSAAAATTPLTSIAKQGARSSQGRSHVCADGKHSRDSRGPGPGFLPRRHAQGPAPPAPIRSAPPPAARDPLSPSRSASATPWCAHLFAAEPGQGRGGGARRGHAPRREPARAQCGPKCKKGLRATLVAPSGLR